MFLTIMQEILFFLFFVSVETIGMRLHCSYILKHTFHKLGVQNWCRFHWMHKVQLMNLIKWSGKVFHTTVTLLQYFSPQLQQSHSYSLWMKLQLVPSSLTMLRVKGQRPGWQSVFTMELPFTTAAMHMMLGFLVQVNIGLYVRCISALQNESIDHFKSQAQDILNMLVFSWKIWII